jgi:hypothetical protein
VHAPKGARTQRCTHPKVHAPKGARTQRCTHPKVHAQMDDKAKEDSSNISPADKTNMAAEALIKLDNNTVAAEQFDEVYYIPQPSRKYDGMKYLCILNRDKMSDKTIQGKTARAFNLEDYEYSLQLVSVQCSWFK